MLREEYAGEIAALGDAELIKRARSALLWDGSGASVKRWKRNAIARECAARRIDFLEAALESAEEKINKFEAIMSELKLIDIKDFHQMEKSRLVGIIETIGASKNHPILEDENSVSRSFEELLKIKIDDVLFGLVSGESMQNIDVRDGDVVVIDKNEKPSDNSIVVVRLDGDIYIKRLKIFGGKVWLCSENDDIKPFEAPETSDLAIYGVAKHIIRSI